MAKANLTMSADISVRAREIDFVTSFGADMSALAEIFNITRFIKKDNGTELVSKRASVELQDGNVAEGEEVPYSKATVEPIYYEKIKLEKYSKAVTAESILDHGADVAITMTDEEFKNELVGNVLDRFYAFLLKGELKNDYATFQMAVAMAIGNVKDKFKKMRKRSTDVVVFVNTLDAYAYLGAAEISMQTQNGLDYVENFMGARKMVISSEIPQGKVIATPMANMQAYYVDPSNEGLARAGLVYAVDAEMPLVGFHANGDYRHVVGESDALMGFTLFAEYLDAIAVNTVGALGE
jgi:hypothetical protein